MQVIEAQVAVAQAQPLKQTMPQNSSHLSSQKILRWIAARKSSYLAFSITMPSWLRSIATGIFSTRPRPLFHDFSIALALLLAAVLLRLLDDPMVSGRLPFTTSSRRCCGGCPLQSPDDDCFCDRVGCPGKLIVGSPSG